MVRPWKPLVLAALLVAGGCSHEAYGVFGNEGEVFTGQMSGYGGQGDIEISNGKGTSCVGRYVSHRPASGSGTLLGTAIALASGSSGRTFLACNNGERVLIEFSSLSVDSGYGYGTTTQGRPVSFTYGLSRAEAARYVKAGQPAAASTPGSPPGPGPARTIATGTGFYITHQGHILTAAHVIKGCSALTVASVGGAPVAASVVAKDVQNDLAVLASSVPPPAVAMFRSGRPVRPGEPVVVYGFPLTGALSSSGSVTVGAVSALSGLHDDTRLLQVSAPVQPGNSGGPVLDESGAVIGIVKSELNAVKVAQATGSVPQNVNFAVKADFARTFLEANGVSATTAPPGRALGAADIGERARAFSVLIECKG